MDAPTPPPSEEPLYTPAMLADVVDAPLAAIRRWWRRGYLHAARETRRLPHFEMSEVHVARRLATLLREGCSLARIDRLVSQLIEAAPGVERPLLEMAIVVQEGRVYLRRGGDLAEPTGQLLLDFDGANEQHDSEGAAALIPFNQAKRRLEESANSCDPVEVSVDEARVLAFDLQAVGDLEGAIDACRAALFAGGGGEDHAMLAELLYRTGDLPAARERYYASLEQDPDDFEARVSLGCLLAEMGSVDLAAAALRGAVAVEPGFADAHYHLARVLDELGERREAETHWRRFLEVSPASPWGDEARDRLGLEPDAP